MNKKTIRLPVYNIVVQLSAEGSGVITSDLHEELDEDIEGGSEEDTNHDRYEAAIDGIESLILAHACAGIDIESPAYLEGIETAIYAIDHAY